MWYTVQYCIVMLSMGRSLYARVGENGAELGWLWLAMLGLNAVLHSTRMSGKGILYLLVSNCYATRLAFCLLPPLSSMTSTRVPALSLWWRQVERTALRHTRGALFSLAQPCLRRHLHSGPRSGSGSDSGKGPGKGDKVIVAMSGGVDSSVTALLMAQQDVDVRAVFMRNWYTLDETGTHEPGSGGAAGCEWQQDWEDVQRVCARLGGIPVQMVDLSREYWVNVFEPALVDWADGVTPNPDVECNREIKFGALLDRLVPPSPGAEAAKTWLATGHYAQVDWSTPRPRLLRARDRSKDQTYYLSSLRESRLAHAHFPLAHHLKSEVKALARAHALVSPDRRESMGLCFVGQRAGRFSSFLDGYIAPQPGDLVDPHGRVLGRHAGLHTLTVGEKARIGGRPERLFVARKHAHNNSMVVVPAGHPMLFCTKAYVHHLHWIWDHYHPPRNATLLAQVRHRQQETPCTLTRDPHGRWVAHFHQPQLAVAKGQKLGLWDGEWCLGSGTIVDTATLDDEPEA